MDIKSYTLLTLCRGFYKNSEYLKLHVEYIHYYLIRTQKVSMSKSLLFDILTF